MSRSQDKHLSELNTHFRPESCVPPPTRQLLENLGPGNECPDCTALSQIIITLHTSSTHVLSGDLPGVCVTVTGDDQLLHELLIGDQVPLKPTDMGAMSRN